MSKSRLQNSDGGHSAGLREAMHALRSELIANMTVYETTKDSPGNPPMLMDEDLGDSVPGPTEADRPCVYLRFKSLKEHMQSLKPLVRRIAVAARIEKAERVVFLEIAERCPEIFATLVTMYASEEIWKGFLEAHCQENPAIAQVISDSTNRSAIQRALNCTVFNAADFQLNYSFYHCVKLSYRKKTSTNDPNYCLPLLERHTLGGGAYGTVYRVKVASEYLHGWPQTLREGADITAIDFTCAMKKLKHDAGHREWKIMAHQHDGLFKQDESPNVMLALACVQTYDATYIFYPLATCDMLTWMTVRCQQPTDNEKLQMFMWLQQVCDGLRHLFGRLRSCGHNERRLACLHRDIKPDNILLVHIGQATLAQISDFGIAEVLTHFKHKGHIDLGQWPQNATKFSLVGNTLDDLEERRAGEWVRSSGLWFLNQHFTYEVEQHSVDKTTWGKHYYSAVKAPEKKLQLGKLAHCPPEAILLAVDADLDVEAATMWQLGSLLAHCVAWLIGGGNGLKEFLNLFDPNPRLFEEAEEPEWREYGYVKVANLRPDVAKFYEDRTHEDAHLRSCWQLIRNMLECEPSKRIRLPSVQAWLHALSLKHSDQPAPMPKALSPYGYPAARLLHGAPEKEVAQSSGTEVIKPSPALRFASNFPSTLC